MYAEKVPVHKRIILRGIASHPRTYAQARHMDPFQDNRCRDSFRSGSYPSHDRLLRANLRQTYLQRARKKSTFDTATAPKFFRIRSASEGLKM